MKALRLLAIAAVAIIVASCSSKPEISYLPAKADGDSSWGLVDANGEFLYSDEFDGRPSAVVNGLFYVSEDGGYTVYKATKKTPKQVGDLCQLVDCGFFNDGVMPIVRKGEHISFVDADGNTKFTLEKVDSLEIIAASEMFINGRCAIRNSEGRWGAIDNTGKVVIPLKYEAPMLFVEKYAIVNDVESEKFLIIDKDGNKVANISVPLNYYSHFIDGIAAAKTKPSDDDSESKCVFIKDNGEVINLPSSVDDIGEWNYKYAVFENEEGDCGIITIDGEVKVRAKYDDIVLLANGKYIARKGRKYMYLTPDGDTEKLDEETYSAIHYPALYSRVFDFDFELIEEVDFDDEYRLLSYSGEEKGETLSRINDDVEIKIVFSDYFDYDGLVNGALSLFDANGLKGYPFGSPMVQYVDSVAHSPEWYRGDNSIGVNINRICGPASVSSATIYSNGTIVYDATPYEGYYTWAFNRNVRVSAVNVTLWLKSYRDGMAEPIAAALRDKLGIEVSESYYDDNYVSQSGREINIHISKWKDVPAVDANIDAAPDSVAVDSVVVNPVAFYNNSF